MKKVVRFIKDTNHSIDDRIKGYLKNCDLGMNFQSHLLYFLNIIITGIIIYYIITYHNFLSYGLASALAMYYIKWLKRLWIAQDKEDIDNL